ncbi:MAG TPA: VOC family protein [Candidatus Baltobacteraceae bacterium]|jgi:PhnB protein|nr:VOC family protein [Candidatus Baltobacteraceae bacterium]
MQLEPYIFFYGRCEEALEFYKSAIGGTYELNRFEGSPMADQVPADQRDKVMHASFKGDGFSFMASDGDLSKKLDPDAGNVSISLGLEDGAQAERIFNALADGGKVAMPFADAFWGGKFGIVVDKFATEWMITSG